MSYSALPDPVTQQGFYADTPMKRLFAWLIDVVLIALMVIAILPFTAFIGIFFFFFLMLIVGFIYRTLTISAGSATLGMRLMSIQLRNANGDKFGFGEAFLHTLGYYVSMSTAIIQLASIVGMIATPRKQGLSDMIMGSVMINKPSNQ